MSIFFMHIPKTAGTSITAVLEDNISVVDSMVMKKIRNCYYNNFLDYSLLRTAKVVAGHMPMSVASLMSKPVRKIVFLRNPVDLSISTFNYMKKLDEIDQSEDIADFITSSRGECIKNIQTKWLANAILPNTPTHRESRPFEFGRNVDRIEFKADDLILNDAIKNLSEFEFVGIFEKMERSIELMCERFGFSRAKNSPILNVGGYGKVRDEQLTTLLEEENRFDMQLYESAMQRFESFEVLTNGDTDSCTPAVSLSYAFLDMDEPVRHSGFHSREIWPHWHGVRWTSCMSVVHLECEIAPDVEYVFELLALSIISIEHARDVEIQIDDTPLRYDLTVSGGVWHYRGIYSPVRSISRPLLKIVVPFATAPSVIGLSEDNRTLGLAVKSIKLMPVESCVVDFSSP